MHVRGYIELNTTFGKGDYAVVAKVKYLVLSCSASYNVIVGRRHTLNNICCVISSKHLKAKYPCPNGLIGTVSVDQKEASECYNTSVSLYGKKNAKTSHLCYEVRAEDAYLLDPRDEWRGVCPEPAEDTKEISIKE